MKKAVLYVLVLAILVTTTILSHKENHKFEESSVKSLLTGAVTVADNLIIAKEYCKFSYLIDDDVLCWYGEPDVSPVTQPVAPQPAPKPQPAVPQCTCPVGSSQEMPSPNDVYNELQQYTCVNGVSIEFPVISQAGCPPCYKAPELTVTPGTLTCDTNCGPVDCGSSKTIPTETGTLTCHCNWGGWTHLGEFNFVPNIG